MGRRAVIGATLAVPRGSCHTDRVRARRTRAGQGSQGSFPAVEPSKDAGCYIE